MPAELLTLLVSAKGCQLQGRRVTPVLSQRRKSLAAMQVHCGAMQRQPPPDSQFSAGVGPPIFGQDVPRFGASGTGACFLLEKVLVAVDQLILGLQACYIAGMLYTMLYSLVYSLHARCYNVSLTSSV